MAAHALAAHALAALERRVMTAGLRAGRRASGGVTATQKG